MMRVQPVDRATLRDAGSIARQARLHATLHPLLDTIGIVEGRFETGPGVHCSEAYRVALAPDLLDRADGIVWLRYALELAWLLALPGLTAPACSVLAARCAGQFAAQPGRRTSLDPSPAIFASLTAARPDRAAVDAVCATLAGTHAGESVLSNHDIDCIDALWLIATPTECLLASGGDDRLTLDAVTGLNRYGCTPWPRPGIVSFGSCTASSLSVEAFAAAEGARQSLAAATLRAGLPLALSDACDEVAGSLLTHFGVADLADAVLSASGTDAALVVTGLLAAERPGIALTSVLMSPSETGSGVPDAVQGRHFASASTQAGIAKGQPIDGLAPGPALVTVALRRGDGSPRAMADIAGECDAAIRAGTARGHVVLHAIDGSKTGLSAPDRATCRHLAETHGGRLDIVIDACQARVEPALLRWYLQQGFPVLVTGSKFFAAPGFCGAILFPRERLRRIARDGLLPAGLAPYARLDDGIGSRRCPGLLLRWQAALCQMNAFAQVPIADVRHRLEAIGRAAREVIGRDGRIGLFDAPRPRGFGWSGRRSVFTFGVRQPSGRWMTPGELRGFYEALAAVGSDAAPCQLGQPVELGSPAIGGLRIAVSAAQVVQGGDHALPLATVMGRLAVLLDASFARFGAAHQAAARGSVPSQQPVLTT